MEEKSKIEPETKDNIKAYQETCNTIRHYSNCSYNVRVLVIVQGLVLIGAWILNYEKTSTIILFLIPSMGLLFTVLLARFHSGYFSATNYFYNLASNMEDKLFDEDFRPFKAYNERHNDKYKNFLPKYLILYAPFTLTFIFFLAAIVLSIIKYHCVL